MTLRTNWLALALLVAAACTSESPPAPVKCEAFVLPAGTDLLAPPTTFRAAVVPLFAQSCGFSSCHGNALARNSAGLYLGGKDEVPDATRIRKGLLEASSELTSMPLVVPGEPTKGYLMRKLDGDHCLLDASCEGKSCGQAMPRDNELLPAEVRLVVRRWIAQGAKDD